MLTCLGTLSGGAAMSTARVLGPRGHNSVSDALAVKGTGTVTFSAVVHPHGRVTTAFFEFGLASRYREPRPAGVVYDKSTAQVHLAAGSQVDSISGQASGLVPNALYHLRLVATSSAGRVYSADAPFMTAKDPAPPPPRLGTAINEAPVSGLVLVRARQLSRGRARASRVARLIAGPDFLPLTENRQLSIDSQVDARAGSVRLTAAGPQRPLTQQATFAGGVFGLSQARQGPATGLTTLTMLEDVPGGPTVNNCSGSAKVQTVHARDQGGSFATRGRDSITTASTAGTVWDTVQRCDGTLTIVHHGTVTVADQRLGTTAVVGAGQSYLARAS